MGNPKADSSASRPPSSTPQIRKGDIITLEITDLAGLGDGVGQYEGRPVFVPYTVPGDTIEGSINRIEQTLLRAHPTKIVKASPQRMTPPCSYFTKCGGCSLQHLSDDLYYGMKQRILTNSVQHAGLDASKITPLLRVGPATRRRASLNVKFHAREGEVMLGFYESGSRRINNIEHCVMLEPGLDTLLHPLHSLLERLAHEQLLITQYVTLTYTDTGVDALFQAKEEPTAATLQELASFAHTHDLARITWKKGSQSIPVATRREVQLQVGGAAIALPEEYFLQATIKGQNYLIQEVVAGAKGAKHIVDLFSGCGTYSFPLLQHAPVHAVEFGQRMIDAMKNAANRQQLQRLTCEARDLDRNPLTAEQLAPYDTAVINPPRPGALPQVEQLAKSSVNRVIMVSCNPATFSRDARLLAEHGFTLEKATPIDQFHWNAHLELVAVLRR